MSFGDFDVMVQLIQCASCTAQIKVTSYFGMLLDSAIGPFFEASAKLEPCLWG